MKNVPMKAVAVLSVVASASVTWAAPAAYQTAVMANSPSVYYRFNESNITAGTSTSPATTAADSSGNGYVGNYVGASNPTTVAGYGTDSDNAVTFNGSNQFVQSTDKAFGNSILNSSYEFLFKANAGITSGQPVLFGTANGTGSQQVQAAYIVFNSSAGGSTTPNSLRFYIRTTQNTSGYLNQFAFSAPTLYDGNFHDLLLTYDNGTPGVANSARYTAYIDGTVAYTATATGMSGTVTNFDYYPAFAANDYRTNNGGSFAPVTLDEAALYSTVLTSADALSHAQAAGVPEPASAGLLFGTLCLVGRRRRAR
ncbi:MAG: hypothetical protein ACTHLZ_14405 [Tepidisphaeraceae bacterium]